MFKASKEEGIGRGKEVVIKIKRNKQKIKRDKQAVEADLHHPDRHLHKVGN